MPSVDFVNVTKRFDGVLAVDRATFDVESGEYVCVLGPTGSGKTTLLRLIAGLLKPDDGIILFDGRPVNAVEAHNRNAVYVPQQYALFPHLTVLQNVAFGPLARGKSEDEALEIARQTLEMVRLSGRAQALPSELSGGMQQRVALARGLASGSSLLLLDEPLGALDARLRLELRHRLRELVKQSGITAIHVTHDRDEAMSVADRIMVLRDGRILDYNQPIRVYTRPTGIFVANLIGGASFLEGIVEKVAPDSIVARIRGGLLIKAPAEPLAIDERVILGIRKERVQISPSKLQAENVLEGQVRESRFLGSTREYVIRLTNGDTILSRRFLESENPAFVPQQRISVSFKQSDVMIFTYPPHGLRNELAMI
jgi:ABC-type Fe3+/spermidine/putrescine transport system ATPase subunit